jgi:hypothetical protein
MQVVIAPSTPSIHSAHAPSGQPDAVTGHLLTPNASPSFLILPAPCKARLSLPPLCDSTPPGLSIVTRSRCELDHVPFSSDCLSADCCHSFQRPAHIHSSLGFACPLLSLTAQIHPFASIALSRSVTAPSQQLLALASRLDGALDTPEDAAPYAPLPSIPRPSDGLLSFSGPRPPPLLDLIF